MRAILLSLFVATVAVGSVACRRAVPEPPAACAPSIRTPWLRMAPAAMPMAAGYLVIENRCHRAVTLIAATSPDFASVTLHESRIENGVSRMRAMTQLTLQPGKHLQFAPGSYHLMLMQPLRALRTGDSVRVVFNLREGGTLDANLPVREVAP